jgi:hypothetical protein
LGAPLPVNAELLVLAHNAYINARNVSAVLGGVVHYSVKEVVKKERTGPGLRSEKEAVGLLPFAQSHYATSRRPASTDREDSLETVEKVNRFLELDTFFIRSTYLAGARKVR